MPVSSNVSHHQYRFQKSVALSHKSDCWQLQLSITSGTGFKRQMTKPKLKLNHAFGTVQRCFTGSEVSQWLALRAGVLRRAVSQSGTALMRGARRVKRWLKVEVASAINRPRTPHLQLPLRTDRSRTLFGPQNVSCALNLQSFKSATLAVGLWFRFQDALANQSLNRTFCGVRPLSFISFSPNSRTPQNAG